MFARYIEIRSVNKLVAELKAHGVTSKRWINRVGEAQGGVPLVRGVLYQMPRNRSTWATSLTKSPCILGSTLASSTGRRLRPPTRSWI